MTCFLTVSAQILAPLPGHFTQEKINLFQDSFAYFPVTFCIQSPKGDLIKPQGEAVIDSSAEVNH